MRSTRWARWATCAVALAICIPALAETAKKSVSDCTSFQQTEKGEDKIELSVHNSCKVPLDCNIKWRVVCAPDAKRRAVHQKSSVFKLAEGTQQSAEASAAVCGADSFSIDNIEWGCEPNKD
jgi:hypothetical protein